MIANKWYKFTPYGNNGEKTITWYMESDGSDYKAFRYIGRFTWAGKYEYHNNPGTFSNSYPYTELSSMEEQWVKEVVDRGEYFPIEETKDYVSNNYLIY